MNKNLHLPPSVYTSIEPWNPEPIRAMAIYCSDGRWGAAFDELCRRHLLVPRYDRWVVPGGPGCLIGRDGNDVSPFVREQVDFLVQAHELERLILITHYGCGFYGHLLQKSADECLETQMNEMKQAAALLKGWYPQMLVQPFLAMISGNALTFHAVDV